MVNQTRARGQHKKEKKYNKILETGRELFMLHGNEGFSMRALARKIGMSKGNLYNYVGSKRELWFGIVSLEYEQFEQKMKEIVQSHQGSKVDLLIKLGEFFLNFCAEDFRRYQMMFIHPPPKSEKKGPIEDDFKYNNVLGFIRGIFEEAIKNDEIEGKDANSLTLYYWGLVLGAAKVEANLEPMNIFMQTFFEDRDDYDRRKFRSFFLQKTNEQLRKA